MSYEVKSGLFGDVFEMTFAVILEQHVSAQDRRDEEVLITVIVDIGERSGYADPIRQANSSILRDVPELAATEILPEFVAANLIQKVDVVESIAIDIGNRDAISVVVVGRLVVPGCVVDDMVDEGDSTLFKLV